MNSTLNIFNWKNKNSIDLSCSILKKGGVIIYPTDTLYGLGCDATNSKAIKKINLIKKRQTPISVITNSPSDILNWVNVQKKYINGILKKLTTSNTIIFPIKNNIVSDLILGEGNTLGVRIPKHDFCNQLTKAYKKPITTTSVNYTGEKPLTNPELMKKKVKK